MRFARLMQLQSSFPSSGELGSAEARTAPEERAAAAGVPAGSPDALLIERIAAGDSLAFRDLVVRHADRAYVVALRILRDHDVAQALVDRLLAEVWESGGRCLDQSSGFRGWIWQRVAKTCPAGEGIAGSRPSSPGGPQAEPEPGFYSGAALDRAMARLAWPERVAIVLAYHEAATVEEIAGALQLATPQVEALLDAARRSLLASLAPMPTRSAAEMVGCEI